MLGSRKTANQHPKLKTQHPNKMNKKLIVSSISILLVLPILTLAYVTPPPPGSGYTFEQVVQGAFNIIWPILAAATAVIFLIAAFMFVTSQGDPTKVAAARQAVIWGVVGLIAAIISFSMPNIIRVLSGL
ncbi:MAG: hypothetical protein A3C58_00235 [Candidatus Staskawiczbacteria bacterium RIFCSPHIGHO2_02_FULL_34_10]|uniref:Uncharacterized protein n=2 Tax=Candidatus Staskawicziibacteriota TaxID=1817916 RepID=A0A1G2HXL2_9BACT|nr:MAG: hypothetical protein A3C58_00235 [Candidatus Staskawiczbacteria bacterium RIFCSPHIGHO2_02_FULL_34_10]